MSQTYTLDFKRYFSKISVGQLTTDLVATMHVPPQSHFYSSPKHLGMTNFLFDSTQSQKVLILTQFMNHDGFQELIQINSGRKVVLWNLIQIDS